VDIEKIEHRLRQDIEKLRSSKGYLNAGYPRYNTLFGRDTIISAWQILKIDPSIAQATLLILSEYQGEAIDQKSEEEPGKILHEHRFDPKEQAKIPEWKFPYYGSIDSTPLYIILAAKYLKTTNDIAFISKIWENIRAAFNWIITYGDKDRDGYIEYQRINPHGLFHQGWRDSREDHLKIKPPVAIVEAQGYVYATYHSLAYIAQRLNKNNDLIREAVERAEKLKKKFNKDFWVEEEKYFALALDGEEKQKKVVSSNPGHLLFTRIVDEDKLNYMVKRLFQPDLWTPYGTRTQSAKDPDFDPYSYHLGSVWPHDNWIIYKGLQKLGYHRQAEKIKQALLRAYRKLNKIPELYTAVNNEIVDLSMPIKGVYQVLANPLQAWASAGLLEMITSN